MRPYIFMERNGIHIIDVKKTQAAIENVSNEITQLAKRRKYILFVGTKKQAKEIVSQEAKRCGMPYVTERWLGGMLTNFQTIRQSIRRMEDIAKMHEDGSLAQLKKKERLMRARELEKLERNLSGISRMPRVPDAIFVVDIRTASTSPLTKQGDSASLSSPSSTPTAIPTWSTSRFQQTTTPCDPSS